MTPANTPAPIALRPGDRVRVTYRVNAYDHRGPGPGVLAFRAGEAVEGVARDVRADGHLTFHPDRDGSLGVDVDDPLVRVDVLAPAPPETPA